MQASTDPMPPNVNQQGPKAHPVLQFFHWFFRATAAIYFVFCELLFTSDFVINFVIVTVLLAADFWTVKNVTGRLLVGLRWWNEPSQGQAQSDKEETTWRFEAKNADAINGKDKSMFWGGLMFSMIFWCVALLVEVVKFDLSYVVLVLLAISMTFTNAWGYFKCTRWAKKNPQELVQQTMFSAVANNFGTLMNIV